ncbi:MAG: class I SAM-dependent methyltransferase [Desulfobacteraceae bacterium]|nr:class I SAM-dependent methyltransferase [Desulfobacteraceae bacterium]
MMIDFEFASDIKGFMHDDEALLLYQTSLKAAESGALLEIGSYCGKSAYFIGLAAKEKNGILFSIDHHKGSEEQQPGQEYFDPDLFDENTNRINTLPIFEKTIEKASLYDVVVPIVAESAIAGKMWSTPLSMLFIDGGHSLEDALKDYNTWEKHIIHNCFLVIHDIFYNPEEGGQAPRIVYEKALNSGRYKKYAFEKTLGVLKRL